MKKRKMRNSQVWLTPEVYALISAAAQIVRRPLCNFIETCAIIAAKQIVAEQANQQPKENTDEKETDPQAGQGNGEDRTPGAIL